MRVKRLDLTLCLALVCWSGAPRAQEVDLRLALPKPLTEMGLATHLLPRFRFRTRIRIAPAAPGVEADMVLGGPEGAPVFSDATRAYRLAIVTSDPDRAEQARRFAGWLLSPPGQAAIASFEIDGARPLVPGEAEAVPDEPVSVEGDASEGAKLALAHCGRCHVVDARNPFGGIGSTPSFGAMRSAPDWLERFSAFWAFNPHPAFTQVADITEPFSDQRPPPIAPLELTLDEVMAITAFVATLPPKDLGARVQAR